MTSTSQTDDRQESTSKRPLPRRLRDRLRTVNKHVLNPLALGFAGRRYVPYGLVRHVGRRSRRVYDTPVLMATDDDRVLVPLPYGSDTDWVRNVRAAGDCTVVWQGDAYRAESPRLIALEAGRDAVPGWLHRSVRAVGTEQYLELDRGERLPAEYLAIAEDHPAGPAAAVLAGVVALAVLAWRVVRPDG